MTSENTSYLEDFDSADGVNYVVQGSKGSNRVTISIDRAEQNHSFWLNLQDAAQLRDALTAICLRLEGGVKQG